MNVRSIVLAVVGCLAFAGTAAASKEGLDGWVNVEPGVYLKHNANGTTSRYATGWQGALADARLWTIRLSDLTAKGEGDSESFTNAVKALDTAEAGLQSGPVILTSISGNESLTTICGYRNALEAEVIEASVGVTAIARSSLFAAFGPPPPIVSSTLTASASTGGSGTVTDTITGVSGAAKAIQEETGTFISSSAFMTATASASAFIASNYTPKCAAGVYASLSMTK